MALARKRFRLIMNVRESEDGLAPIENRLALLLEFSPQIVERPLRRARADTIAVAE